MARLAFILAIFLQITITHAAENKPYKFGVFPYLSPVRMDKIYSPISAELSRDINHKIRFHTSSSFSKFLAKLESEHYDFALIQPFWYPVAVDKHNYQPSLRMQEPFVSLIMVLDNSPYQDINDLKGKTIATPPAFVPVVHMARRSLFKHNLVPGKDLTFKAFNSVDSCFQQVLIGKASACVSPPFAPAIFEKSMNVKLRTLLRSPGIPNLSLVIHSRVPTSDHNKIKTAVLNWSASAHGKKLLNSMQTSGFVPIKDIEYNVVRDFIKEIKKLKN